MTLLIPRNARDPEQYAVGRAQQFVAGLPAPEYIELNDFSKFGTPLQDEIFARLHFHGYYED